MIAQYPDSQAATLVGLKNNMPCILPHVIFINCRILVESVLSGGGDLGPIVLKSKAVLAEKLRRGPLDRRWRVFSLGRGGDGATEGYPMDPKASAGREAKGELVASEPRRCLVLDTREDGEASFAGSPVFTGFLLRSLPSMLPSSSVLDTDAECSLRPFDTCDLDLGERGSCCPLLADLLTDVVLGSGVTTLMEATCSAPDNTAPCLSTVEDLLLECRLTFFELFSIRL